MGGLVKFDGSGWAIYNTSNSGLPSNEVYAIALDDNNNKWIGTAMGGLAVFNQEGVQLSVSENQKLQSKINVYPNPVSDYLNIEGPHSIIISKIEILNMQGAIVISLKTIDTQNTISLADFPNGIYILRISTNEGVMTTKLIKQ